MSNVNIANTTSRIEFFEGDFSEYCSFNTDDHIGTIKFSYNTEQMANLASMLSDWKAQFRRSFAVNVADLLQIGFLNEDSQDVQPMYMRLSSARLHSEGYIEVSFESKHTSEDFWRTDFAVV
ncbi:hypothetical protein [Thiomicrorhabdus aquaedulcis]|uniref:hypothetical protein n=1 Tax=Thiomicrorhabdus aquaedulcis TaxID=2211106 RepID=UPI000FDA52EC|nr:hypothetical protein [Thiomicrorhabdus aquaedulcis]